MQNVVQFKMPLCKTVLVHGIRIYKAMYVKIILYIITNQFMIPEVQILCNCIYKLCIMKCRSGVFIVFNKQAEASA